MEEKITFKFEESEALISKDLMKKEFIQVHNNCCFCGTPLQLKHKVEQNTKTIREDAFCPRCEIKTRAKIYPLN